MFVQADPPTASNSYISFIWHISLQMFEQVSSLEKCPFITRNIVVQAALYQFVLQTFSFHGVQPRYHWWRKWTLILQIYLRDINPLFTEADRRSALKSNVRHYDKYVTYIMHRHRHKVCRGSSCETEMNNQLPLKRNEQNSRWSWKSHVFTRPEKDQGGRSHLIQRPHSLCPQDYINSLTRKDKPAWFNTPIYNLLTCFQSLTLLRPEDHPTDLTLGEIHTAAVHPHSPANKTHKLCVYIRGQKNDVPGINKRWKEEKLLIKLSRGKI